MKKKMVGVLFTIITFFAGATVSLAEGAASGPLESILPIAGYILFFGGIMYLLVYMPPKRKDKKAKELISSLKVGHKITTHSGIVGKVVNIKDDVITVESGIERTQIELKKWAIRDVDKPIEA
jgi:preprotein translocase subunit YajC